MASKNAQYAGGGRSVTGLDDCDTCGGSGIRAVEGPYGPEVEVCWCVPRCEHCDGTDLLFFAHEPDLPDGVRPLLDAGPLCSDCLVAGEHAEALGAALRALVVA